MRRAASATSTCTSTAAAWAGGGHRHHPSGWIGDSFIRNSGFLAVADASDMILLFPQARPRLGHPAQVRPLASAGNGNGCWDWWGYLGEAQGHAFGQWPCTWCTSSYCACSHQGRPTDEGGGGHGGEGGGHSPLALALMDPRCQASHLAF